LFEKKYIRFLNAFKNPVKKIINYGTECTGQIFGSLTIVTDLEIINLILIVIRMCDLHVGMAERAYYWKLY